MFEKKYIFETKKTKLRRLVFNGSVLLISLLICYTILCFYIPYYGQITNQETKNTLFKKSPDLIVIYTGGAGRIAFGLEVAKNYPNSKVYISGVYNKNSVQTLIDKQIKPQAQIAEQKLEETTTPIQEDLQGMERPEKQIFQFVDLDYQAKNTIENVIYTLHYLRTSKEHQNVLIISSDYHILRINWLVNSLKTKTDHFNISYLGMKTDFSTWGSLKILFRETLKVIKTGVFLLVWDKEYSQTTIKR